jgi:hypothetical protein
MRLNISISSEAEMRLKERAAAEGKDPTRYAEELVENAVTKPRELPNGSAALLRKLMHEPPHIPEEDVRAMERAIEEARLPVNYDGDFDEGGE